MNISEHIKNWARITLKESCDRLEETNYPYTDGFPQAEKDICDCPECGEKMYESEENSLLNHFKDFFKDNTEVTVFEEDGYVYIGFDASGYDNKSHADQEFYQISKEVEDEIAEVNKYEHSAIDVMQDDRNEYTLKIVQNSGVDENCQEKVSESEGNPNLTVGKFIEDLSKCDKDCVLQFADNENDQLLNYVRDINCNAIDDNGRKTCVVNLEYVDFVLESENLTDDQKTLKEYFDQAKKENGELKVHYIKQTDGTERTAIFSTSANVGASFKVNSRETQKKLKTINKNHDRVYSHEVEYHGGLVTFPEKITEETPHVTNVNDAEDGTKWQWRKLYIENILDVSYNGEIVWKNENPSSNLAGRKEEVRTTVSKEEEDKNKESYEKYQREEERRHAEYKAMRKQAVEMAKNMTEEDCSVNVGYADANGFDYLDTKNKIMVMALRIKHDELCRTNPSKHEMIDTSRNPMRGDHSMKCKGCNYAIAWDSSD